MDDVIEPQTQQQKERRCLMCGIKFPSEGAHNRICRRCKSTVAWRQG